MNLCKTHWHSLWDRRPFFNYVDQILPPTYFGWHLQRTSYSLINMRQLHTFFYQTKTWHVIVCWFLCFTPFSLNLPDLNLKLFWTSKQNNFRFKSGKFRGKWGKTQKSTNNRISSFGLIEKDMKLSHIYLAVILATFR